MPQYARVEGENAVYHFMYWNRDKHIESESPVAEQTECRHQAQETEMKSRPH